MRNRYFDLLRAVAIVRVVVYHATEASVLSIVFPSMGVMFALGGSLMASSLDRRGSRAVISRLRRVLPPLWMVGALFVPAMVLTGLSFDWHLVFWVLPLQDPPTNWWGEGALHTLWYLREYLWFVLLSPGALWLFRRWPVPTLVAPLALMVAIQAGLPSLPAIDDLGQYFSCWLIGFAHHDGMLRRMKRGVLLVLAGVTAAAGAAWFLTHPSSVKGYHLGDIPLGDALWSVGFVLVLVGLAPARADWVDRWRPVSRIVTVLNSRAMTIYLWHKAVIIGCGVVVGFEWWETGPTALVTWLTAVAAGVAICTVMFGWVDDLAARRRVVLVPAVEEWARARTPAALSRRRAGPPRPETGGVRPHHHHAHPPPRPDPRGGKGSAADLIPVRRPA
jgi:peptidoglycan/LPS O-acetylase OafA/YrhL